MQTEIQIHSFIISENKEELEEKDDGDIHNNRRRSSSLSLKLPPFSEDFLLGVNHDILLNDEEFNATTVNFN